MFSRGSLRDLADLPLWANLLASGRRAGTERGTAVADQSRDQSRNASPRKTRGKAPVGDGIREHKITVYFTTREKSLVTVAAAHAGLAKGAWIGRVAVDAAERHAAGEIPDRESVIKLVGELRERRRLLAILGNNINQFAAGYNATGVVENPNAVSAALDLIRERVLALDDVVDRINAEFLR